VLLGRDELEALRLADVEGLYHDAAAERMGVSRATFGRILSRARRTVADALLGGKVLLFSSGTPVQEASWAPRCPVHGHERRRGRGCRCQDGGSEADHREAEP
jgi:uncharacterized protein